MKSFRVMCAIFILWVATSLAAQTVNWTSGAYVYDGAGNIAKIGSDIYIYDGVSRIVSGTAASHSQAFSYDTYGNLTSIVTDANTTTAVYPGVSSATNRMDRTTGGANVYGTYDGAGNMVSYVSAYSYAYDGLNMMKEATGPNNQHDFYIYTADDERIATISVTGSQNTITGTRWTLRGLDNKVLRELDDTIVSGAHTWNWKEDYVYGGGLLIASETNAPDHTLHFFPDHLGSPRVITGSGGAVVAKHTYYPYGEEATSKTQDAEVMKFTGHERDASLDYMHARFTNPNLGRFLSVDPCKDWNANSPQSWNLYTYAKDNPANFSDPTGCVSIGEAWGKFMGVIDKLWNSWSSKANTTPIDRNIQATNTDPDVASAGNRNITMQRGNLRDGAQEAVSTVGSAVTQAAVTAVVFKGLNKAGETIAMQLEVSEHALERMGQRGITLERLQATVSTGERFKYFHDGIWKVGFYDAQSRTFASGAAGRILTVINNVKPQYIENLKKLTP